MSRNFGGTVELPLHVAGFSFRGRRRGQEDCWYAETGEAHATLVVADGMGGYKAGALASRLVVDSFVRALGPVWDWEGLPAAMQHATRAANDELLDLGSRDEKVQDLGSTVVAAAVRDGKFLVGHVGDSRAWLILPDDVRPLTTDHSLAHRAVTEGSVPSLTVARKLFGGAVYRCVGDRDFAGLEIGESDSALLPDGSILLLTTDGAHEFLTETDLLKHFCEASSLQNAVETLAYLAYTRGSEDNITLVACEHGAFPHADEDPDDLDRPLAPVDEGTDELSQHVSAGPAGLRRRLVRPAKYAALALLMAVALVLMAFPSTAVRSVEAMKRFAGKVVGRAQPVEATPGGGTADKSTPQGAATGEPDGAGRQHAGEETGVGTTPRK